MTNNIRSIVLAGGPCSGKTESIEKVRKYLTEIGYRVVVLPELATEIRKDGLIHTEGIITKVDFQRLIFKLQLFKEEAYKSMLIKYSDPSKVILLLDRGLLDAKVFLPNDEYEKLLNESNLTEQDILNRYDAVFHLESTANMECGCYGNSTNEFRLSNSEQAKIQEEKSIQVWSVHDNFHIVKLEKTFDEKVKKLEKYIYEEINKN